MKHLFCKVVLGIVVLCDVAMAQCTPVCGGDLCIQTIGTNISVTSIVGGCTGQTLELKVSVNGAGQGGNLIVWVEEPNFVFQDISVECTTPGGSISLSVIPRNGGSVSSIRDVYPASGSNGQLWIEQLLPQTIRSVTATRVNQVIATNGDITGVIQATGSGAPHSQNGDIILVRADAGKILGNLYATGSIVTVQASSDIGTSATPVSITWGNNTALSSTSLGTVQGANVYANITATSRNATTTRGNVSKVRATSGVFSGSLTALGFVTNSNEASPGIVTNGNLSASVDLLSGLASNATFRVGGVLSGAITLPASGLVGQIVPNALNATSNAWTGTITLGTGGSQIVLNPASLTNGAYTNTSAALGNGAVGIAPYRLHYADSTYDLGAIPATNSRTTPLVLLQSMLDNNSGLDLVFYGPLQDNGNYPLYVYKPTGDENADEWCDITTKTVQDAVPSSPSNHRNARMIRVRGTSCPFPLGLYRISSIEKDVVIASCSSSVTMTPALCAGTLVTSPAPSLAPLHLYIKVVKDCNGNGVLDSGEENGCGGGGACPADLDDGSGTGTPDAGVTVDDLLYFLVKFEAGDLDIDLDNACGGGVPDNAVTVDDLLYFLYHFELGC